MFKRWTGPLVVLAILGGVVMILLANLNPNAPATRRPPQAAGPSGPADKAAAQPGAGVQVPAGFREYPIGDEVERNQMRIAAVWLPPVSMEGMTGPPPADMIHLEADIHATEGNRNGFAKDEFVPYLVVRYTLTPRADKSSDAAASSPVSGTMMPMVARDGLHYGASITMPKPGHYTLTYHIDPPSAGGLGRHADVATGVDPWWGPFEVSFDWDHAPPGS